MMATKAVFTLCVDDYAPEVTRLTFPFLHAYASKIGADFRIIERRVFEAFPAVYEKLQIYRLGNIFPTVQERNLGIRPEHLLDDYVLSRNIARYGLKFLRFQELQKDLGREGEVYFFHNYLLPVEDKCRQIEAHIAAWGLNGPVDKERVIQAESSNGSGPVLVRS
jgi:hypothetical protein